MAEKKSKTYLLERIWRSLISGGSTPESAGSNAENFYLDKIADILENSGGISGIASSAVSVGFTEYAASIGQAGTNNPVVGVLHDGFGVTCTPARAAEGVYTFTLSANIMTVDKTQIFLTHNDNNAARMATAVNVTPAVFAISTWDANGDLVDVWTYNILIRVFD